MKFFAFALLILAASNAACGASVAKVGNSLDNLIKEALEFIRIQLQTHEPLTIPPKFLPEQVINDPDPDLRIYLNATLSNVQVSDASNFEVRDIENDLDNFWARFEVFLPSLDAAGQYTIVGTVLDKAVQGAGDFTASVTNLDVSGFIQFVLVDHAVQIQDMNVTYTLEAVKDTISGLSIEGVTEEEIENLLNTALLSFFQDNEVEIAKKISRQVIIEGNQIMAGKTLLDIIEWLKNFINPTTVSPAGF